MPFLLLLILSLACLPVRPRPLIGDDQWSSAALTWGTIVFLVAAAALLARRTCRLLASRPDNLHLILHRYATLRTYHLFALFAAHGIGLFVFGWGWTVSTTFVASTGEMVFGGEVFVLLPFVGGLVLSWFFFYDAERALRQAINPAAASPPFGGRWGYIAVHARHNLALILVPLALLITEQGLLRRYPWLERDEWFQLATLTLLGALFIGMPWILRLALGLQPLPPGPLRDRLLATARRLKFRLSNILLWRTRGGVANAMVVGVLPYPRYVLLTDRLINDLSADEVEAVFGHEVGHVKHHHMLFYAGFMIMSLMAVGGLWTAASPYLDEAGSQYFPEWITFIKTREEGAVLPLIAMLGTYVAYIFVVFGFLSRRCERQADIYGCRAVSCADPTCLDHGPEVQLVPEGRGLCPTGILTFIHALEKVACLNGISRNRPGWLQSWQHSTIARRVEFLQRMLADPGIEQRFQRRVGLVKWSLLLVLSLILLILGARQGWDVLMQF